MIILAAVSVPRRHRGMDASTRSRLPSLLVGLLMNLVGGTPFMFAAFEHKLKDRYNYTETEGMLISAR